MLEVGGDEEVELVEEVPDSMQQSGYIWEKGKTQGKTMSETERSGVYQLTLTTFSYSSAFWIGMGM